MNVVQRSSYKRVQSLLPCVLRNLIPLPRGDQCYHCYYICFAFKCVFFLILSIHYESKSYPHFIDEENETQLEDN